MVNFALGGEDEIDINAEKGRRCSQTQLAAVLRPALGPRTRREVWIEEEKEDASRSVKLLGSRLYLAFVCQETHDFSRVQPGHPQPSGREARIDCEDETKRSA